MERFPKLPKMCNLTQLLVPFIYFDPFFDCLFLCIGASGYQFHKTALRPLHGFF